LLPVKVGLLIQLIAPMPEPGGVKILRFAKLRSSFRMIVDQLFIPPAFG